MLAKDKTTAAKTSSRGDAVGYPKFHKITPISQIIKTFIKNFFEYKLKLNN